MPAHRLCLLGRVSSMDPELWSQPSMAPCQPPACVRCPGSEGQPRAQHIWKGAHQIVVKRNEGGRLLKVRILCEGAIFFNTSILKILKSFRKLKFMLWTHIPYPPTQRIIIFLIPSDIFLLHFLLYHVLDHILVVLILFLLCFWLYYFSVACFWQQSVWVVIHPLC